MLQDTQNSPLRGTGGRRRRAVEKHDRRPRQALAALSTRGVVLTVADTHKLGVLLFRGLPAAGP